MTRVEGSNLGLSLSFICFRPCEKNIRLRKGAPKKRVKKAGFFLLVKFATSLLPLLAEG